MSAVNLSTTTAQNITNDFLIVDKLFDGERGNGLITGSDLWRFAVVILKRFIPILSISVEVRRKRIILTFKNSYNWREGREVKDQNSAESSAISGPWKGFRINSKKADYFYLAIRNLNKFSCNYIIII